MPLKIKSREVTGTLGKANVRYDAADLEKLKPGAETIVSTVSSYGHVLVNPFNKAHIDPLIKGILGIRQHKFGTRQGDTFFLTDKNLDKPGTVEALQEFSEADVDDKLVIIKNTEKIKDPNQSGRDIVELLAGMAVNGAASSAAFDMEGWKVAPAKGEEFQEFQYGDPDNFLSFVGACVVVYGSGTTRVKTRPDIITPNAIEIAGESWQQTTFLLPTPDTIYGK